MLVIRDAQMQNLISQNDGELEQLIANAVSKANPPRVDGIRPERVISMVRIGIEKARGIGLAKAEDIAEFTALMFEVSPQFYDQPGIAEVLGDTTYAPEDRLSQLFERLGDDVWEEAVDLYDEKIWFSRKGNDKPEA